MTLTIERFNQHVLRQTCNYRCHEQTHKHNGTKRVKSNSNKSDKSGQQRRESHTGYATSLHWGDHRHQKHAHSKQEVKWHYPHWDETKQEYWRVTPVERTPNCTKKYTNCNKASSVFLTNTVSAYNMFPQISSQAFLYVPCVFIA